MTPMKLSITTRVLHWLIAFVILGMLASGKLIESLSSPVDMQILAIHMSVGLCLTIFLVFRFANRMREGFPEALTPQAKVLNVISRVTHWGLLVVPFLMVGSGFMHEYAGGRDLQIFGVQVFSALDPRDMALKQQAEHFHENAATVLIILVVLHIAGALKHAILGKDGTLKRMIR
jgi:cytochrome b561